MRFAISVTLIVTSICTVFLLFATQSQARYEVRKKEPYSQMTLKEKHVYLHRLKGASVRIVKHTDDRYARWWHRKALKRINHSLDVVHRRMIKRLHREVTANYWVARQIWAATIIGSKSSGDPWPNCPDPFDGGGYSWYDTVQCENGGNWMDSPGFYRCGLQFDPMWERKFGKLCP